MIRRRKRRGDKFPPTESAIHHIHLRLVQGKEDIPEGIHPPAAGCTWGVISGRQSGVWRSLLVSHSALSCALVGPCRQNAKTRNCFEKSSYNGYVCQFSYVIYRIRQIPSLILKHPHNLIRSHKQTQPRRAFLLHPLHERRRRSSTSIPTRAGSLGRTNRRRRSHAACYTRRP